jgi:hypothetical protein
VERAERAGGKLLDLGGGFSAALSFQRVRLWKERLLSWVLESTKVDLTLSFGCERAPRAHLRKSRRGQPARKGETARDMKLTMTGSSLCIP